MSLRPIMDAGPGLNFLSLNKERLLFDTVGPLRVPEKVEEEILRKSRQDRRFSAAENVWRRLPERLLQVLSDDSTNEDLSRAVGRISGTSFEQRIRISKNLGEVMVISHASVAAESGENVIILIDDSGGRQIAAVEARRLDRLRLMGKPAGSIRLISTLTVLQKAAGREHIPNKKSMRTLYSRLRQLDDGLVPIEQTGLLSLPCWK
ncbi:hypothetical protein ACSAM2_01085 [Actinomyces oris]|jgi:hypothetical protein|uniref:hypothetical protein n=1 Tax=Actinomyces TaxID=1654 RepID=UPI0009C00941|nr:hypothetical protein [Actinomyces oris]